MEYFFAEKQTLEERRIRRKIMRGLKLEIAIPEQLLERNQKMEFLLFIPALAKLSKETGVKKAVMM